MSFKNELYFHHSTVSAPARQTITTSYTEVTGTKCEVRLRYSDSVLYYKTSFYLSTVYDFSTGASGSYDKPFLHLKLQKSNDNFSSNIVDINETRHNVSGDTIENRDYYYISHSPMFLVENFGSSTHIRLVARSYSTSNDVDLHRARQWDGNDNNEVYYNTSLLVAEIKQ